MSNSIKKLLILSSGGDSPGMNAGVRAALRSALFHNIEVYGCENGFQGLVDKTVFPMTSRDAANCIQRGGTILKSARCHAFLEKAMRDECRAYLHSLGIDAMVILGGDGSFRGAWVLENEGGPRTIGIPCTIDNDKIGRAHV